jgi:succinyl-CoA synthetase alpha subunit
MPFFLLQVKMIVILGELGGQDEYGVVEALKSGAITKPVVSCGHGEGNVLDGHGEGNVLDGHGEGNMEKVTWRR